MKILLLSGTFDIGGQGHRIVEAFRKVAPDWLVRSMAKAQSYLSYPVDMPFRRHSLEEQYQAADVIHSRVNFAHYDHMAGKFGPKPVVFHGHGTAYRGNPNRYLREARERNAIVLVSTLDLWLLAPDQSEWLPAPYDIDALQELRRNARPELSHGQRSGGHQHRDQASV